jgi:transposase, IS30 family
LADYKRLCSNDRERMCKLLIEGKSQTLIAGEIGVHQTSISRELKLGWNGSGYDPLRAQKQSLRNRATKVLPLKIDKITWHVIKQYLGLKWSPEEIEKSLRKYDFYGTIQPVCAKTIYNYIHFHMKGELKKLALQELRLKGKKRSGVHEKRGKIPNMALIDGRPEEVEGRKVPGHWEGDLIIGKDHKSALCVIVERRTRYVLIDRLLDYSAEKVRESVKMLFTKVEPMLIKTLTWDQGKEMAQHEQLADEMKFKVFFCHPHSPWEKATCENTNYLIRDMCRGETDFRNMTKASIYKIARQLNERPRKTLGYETPAEVITKICVRSY